MEKTIPYEEVASFFNGLVKVRVIKSYNDPRGMVSEVFRVDADITHDSKMCYISETNPFIMRGPHFHHNQRDEFITWKNRMCYMFYDPSSDTSEYYITDPKDIVNVSVEKGIVHSYRNIDILDTSYTLNFPTSLFKGYNKKEEVDEIRYEDKIHDIPTYIVLGAGGRLGKALTNQLFSNMKFHEYNVVPVYSKFETREDIDKFIDLLKIFEYKNISIINCVAITNTAKVVDATENNHIHWVNVTIPYVLSTYCKELNIKFIHISSDYVFRQGDDSPYTTSKKRSDDCVLLNKGMVIRVANLFSLDKSDTNNLLSKLKALKDSNKTITYDPIQYVYPTEVNKLATQIINILTSESIQREYNISGKPITMHDLLRSIMTYKNTSCMSSSFVSGHEIFKNNLITIDNDEEIIKKLM
jgi:dTDP-4-dehydrorhamnose 3,5-epimerase